MRYVARPTAAALSCSMPFFSIRSRGLHIVKEISFSRDLPFLLRFPSSSSSWALQPVWNDVPRKPMLSRVCRPYSLISNSIFRSLEEHTFTIQNLHLHRQARRHFHISHSVCYDRLQNLEDAANRDRDNANAQAILLQVLLLYADLMLMHFVRLYWRSIQIM